MTTMKKLFYIQLFAAVVSIGIFSTSCIKDENAGANCSKTPGYNVLELYFNTQSTRATSSTEQGDKITDVTVWAYEISTADNQITVGNDGKPVGWATKTFSDTYESTEGNGFRMELPYSTEDKIYRLFAVANLEQFGTIYTPLQNGEQTSIASLPNTITYDVLSSYVFEADATLMNTANPASTPELMPVSHWMDLNVEGGSTDIQSAHMTLYRALAKASLVASMSNESSVGANVKITGLAIGAKTTDLRKIPVQGSLFSGNENVAKASSPVPYGDVSDVKSDDYTLAIITPANVTLTNDAGSVTTNQYIGAKFLYENHFGTKPSAAATSIDGFSDGSYYAKIDYKYWSGDESSAKTATGYVALPAVVRNHEIQIRANFTVSVDGAVTLECNVADWVEDTTTSLDFTYPTYSVMTFDRNGSNEQVYDSAIKGMESFTMLFQMSSPTGGYIKWKPVLLGSDAAKFTVEVLKASNVTNSPSVGEIVPHSDGIAGSSQWYAVRVKPNANQNAKVDLSIVFNALWLGQGVNESMLINGVTDNTNWPSDNNDGHYITITQTSN